MHRRNLPYYVFSILLASLIFGLFVWGPIIPFAFSLLSDAPPDDALRAISTAAELALFDSGPWLTSYYAALALLGSGNIVLLVLYWRTRRTIASGSASASGALGTIAILLGFGCISCGTLFLSLAFGSIGGFSLAAIPFADDLSYLLQGLGLVLLSYSLARLMKHVNDPLVCPVA